jgi:hypothetical protein
MAAAVNDGGELGIFKGNNSTPLARLIVIL